MSDWGIYRGVLPESENLFPARITGVNREIYRLGLEGSREERRGELTGRLRLSLDEGAFPVAGDWVLCSEEGELCVIREILPRTSLISRKEAGDVTREQALAANIDVVGIVQGLDGGRNFSGRTLERYLTLAWNSGALPLILLNKADLCEEPEAFRDEAEFIAPGVEILITSASEGRGIEELSRIITGRTAVFIGPSGVGKSALLNALSRETLQKTGENRSADRRGRHTTTSSRLTCLPGGGWLIDSPGLREIQLWGDQEGLEETFPEIEQFAAGCRFRDCRHEGEPGCAVQEALLGGELDHSRYQSYLELRRELDYLDNRRTEKGRSEQKRKGKELSRRIKSMKKGKSVY